MKRNNLLPALIAILFLCVSSASTTMAQGPMEQQGGPGGPGGPGMGMGQQPKLDPSTKRTPVTAGRATGFLYEPITPGPKSHIGIFVMHSGADYTNFSTCYEMSKRGYTVLCTKNSGGGLNSILLDAKSSVAYLRKLPGVDKVILWGHSGGATLMTAYQMIAENGVASCQGPEKLSKCPNNLAGLPAADGMILADSNWGNASMSLFSLDPAVITEGDGVNLNQDLNLFNPKNGFNPGGNSDYSQEFIRKFQAAVGERENRLVKYALDRVAAIDAGKGHFIDDEPMVIAGASSVEPFNKLFPQDVKLMAQTVKAWPLIHADGSVTTEIVHSVRKPAGGMGIGGNQPGRPGAGGAQGTGPAGGVPGGPAWSGGPGGPGSGMGGGSMTGRLSNAVNTTVRDFLMENAIRVSNDFYYDESSVHGIDWTSTYSSPPGNIQSIHVPTLFLGMTGNYEYLAAETIYNNSAAKDKSLAFVEGASHMYSTCKQCERAPGEFGDTIKTLHDYADQWLGQKGRF